MNDSFDTAVGPTNHLCKFPLSHKHSSSTVCIPDTELGSMYTEVNLVRITVFRVYNCHHKITLKHNIFYTKLMDKFWGDFTLTICKGKPSPNQCGE